MGLLARLLATFALGLIATGAVVGLMPAGSNGCGAAFSSQNRFKDSEACREYRAQRRGLPAALIGLGVTAGIAAMVTSETGRKGQRSSG